MAHQAFKSFLLAATVLLSMTSCLKDPITNNPNGDNPSRARFEMTDAPVDDPNVKAMFITVSDIMIDGKSWAGFAGKTTFDLLSFQKGLTKLLGEGAIDAAAYSEIELVLDTGTDANGDSPGCYIRDALGAKRKLGDGTQLVLKVKGNFTAKANETTDAVIDMDLRKAVVYQSGSSTDYQFVTDPELMASVRLIDKSQTGSIKGDCTDGVSGSDQVIVFAYKKGAYDNNEKFPQGASQIQFRNAVTSSVVSDNGSFNLSFLESGAYELHFISFKEDASGKLQPKGELQLSLIDSTLNLNQLNVTANTSLQMDLMVTGILFFG